MTLVKSNSKSYYRKTHTKNANSEKRPYDPNKKYSKRVKFKKHSEETVADIINDIQRIEKEINLEIKEIQSAKLSF